MRLSRFRIRSYAWIIILTVTLALLGSVAFYRPFQGVGVGGFDHKAPPVSEPPPDPPPALPVKRSTYLIMGVDYGPFQGGRSDTLIVASYDPGTQQIALLSLPRDTWVHIPGYGFDKLNHAYAYGREALTIKTVEGLLAIPIDHYITISFDGFEQIVDALGGVHIDAEKRMYYEDPYDLSMGPDGLIIDIQAGPQDMDGRTALGYSRFRADDEGDIGRMRRQQQIIMAMVQKVASPSVLPRIPQLISALYKTVITDMSVAELVTLATQGKESLKHPVRTGSWGGRAELVDGIFYLVPDLERDRALAYEILIGGQPSEEFVQRARTDQARYAQALEEAKADDVPPEAVAQPEPEVQAPSATATESTEPKEPEPPRLSRPQPITVAVIDGTGAGLGQEYAARLKAAGFRVSRVTTAASPVARTTVLDRAGQPNQRERLEEVFSDLFWVTALDPTANEPLELILGRDLVPAR